MSGQLHAPAALPPWERTPGIHSIGGWVGPRAGLDEVEKRNVLTLPRLELRPFCRPARSQSLYRLRYPGFRAVKKANDIESNAYTSERHSKCIKNEKE
jgi:hypothetical protein